METLEETKAYNARQPRDDHGRWSDGAGGISEGHAAHVMRSEGISDEKAAAVLAKINDGTHQSREDVLAHIDSIHAAGKAPKIAEIGSAVRFTRNGVERVDKVDLVGPNGVRVEGGGAVPHGDYEVVDASHLPRSPREQHAAFFDSAGHSEPFKEQWSKTIQYGDNGPARAESLAREYEKEVAQELKQGNEEDARGAARSANAIRLALKDAASKKSVDTMPDDTLIAFGEGIKSVEETADSYKFGAFLVVFDSPDISNFRDSFTKSTDFGFEDGDTRPILYNHGLDGTFGKSTIGKARLYLKDAGVWMEGEVKKRRDYLEKHIERVGEGLKATVKHRGIEAPMFGASSGATSHAVVREAKGAGHEIKQWFIGEASITPTPAEPFTACMSLKSLVEVEAAAEDETDELKRYNPRQPRDDAGRWDSGGASGGLTANHAIAVMRAEGITDTAKHEEVARAISAGIHTSPDHVLRHIDRIHWANGNGVRMDGRAQAAANKPELQPAQEITSRKMGSYGGRRTHEVATESLPLLNADGSKYGDSASPARVHIEETAPGSNLYSAHAEHYVGGSGDKEKQLIASGVSLKEAKQRASDALEKVVGTEPGGKHVFVNSALKPAPAAQPEPRGPSQADLQRAVTNARASVAAAQSIGQKIMDARNASLDMGRRVTKSDDADDLDALFEAWDGHAAAALDALQTELAPQGAVPGEVKASGTHNPYEIGRYVQSQLAKSGVILGAIN